ncbi:alpha-N-acetylgalactosamine-specific lectin-like [Dunckerocampus dactyliophorus]|uniref:alpha-N-acetylgalactosamine-specific lectin-like n=1 Tax=Dunckerocampus dactyliophorus TaxID=161453 RepID=UPI0024059E27|nr:alpha-N-acetylgalactosamine-specific lectin-like [Dunckerocampus dactyliophorus]
MASAFHVFFLLCGISGLVAGSWYERTVRVPSCPKNFTRVDDRCFRFIHEERTFEDAELVCNALGGNLASVISAVENEIILELARSDPPQLTWIGYNDIAMDTTFVWTDGTDPGFTNWETVAPVNATENCVLINGNGDFWDDEECGEDHYFVCVACPH